MNPSNLTAARKLIAQFETGTGRHNSRHDTADMFSRVSPMFDVHQPRSVLSLIFRATPEECGILECVAKIEDCEPNDPDHLVAMVFDQKDNDYLAFTNVPVRVAFGTRYVWRRIA